MNKNIKRFVVSLLCVLTMILAVGCKKEGASVAANVPITDIVEAVKTAYGENYVANMELDATMLEELYGVKPEMYTEVYGAMPMMSAQVDTFIAVRAAEGQADAVEAALNGYRDYLVADTFQYPMNLPKIAGSKVYRNGDYVFFIMLGTMPMEVIDQGDEAAKAHAEEQNQIAIDTINGLLNK